MNELPNSNSDRFAIIKHSGKNKRTIILGLLLCLLLLGLIIFIWSQEVESIEARIEGDREVIYAPVFGKIVEMPKQDGDSLRKGEALLRFDPIFIRRQNNTVREYLAFFQQNRQNPGLLRNKFSNIFAHIFDELAKERKKFVEKEEQSLALYKEKTLEYAKIKVQMRDPSKQSSDGKANAELMAMEQNLSAELDALMLELEKASLARAEIDREIRAVTNDLSEPHGMLYIFLEEEHKKAQKLLKYEYLYSGANGKMGNIFVKVGDIVNEGDALYEILPEATGQWFVHAVFTADDAKKLKERDICTVTTEDGLEFEARIESLKPSGEVVNVQLIIQKAPEGLQASKFAKVTK